MSLSCVRVGFGSIARIHEDVLGRLGVETVAVVEADPGRHDRIREVGLTPVADYGEAAARRPGFWDVCTPTESHAEVLSAISAADRDADVIVEKPICDHGDLPVLRPVLEGHRGRIVVNENYCSSVVTEAVVGHVARLALRPTKVIVEMTKHRGPDYLAGRFIDPVLGAFGYEGSHLIAAVASLGESYRDGAVYDLDVDDIALDDAEGSVLDDSAWDAEETQGRVVLCGQGGAFVGYETQSGCRVELYTSMSGIVGYPCPPYAPPSARIEPTDPVTRYRVFRVDGTDPSGTAHQVVGFYEPLPGRARGEGAVALFREWEMTDLLAPLGDDTMIQHLHRTLRHFSGQGPNPCPPHWAVRTLEQLHRWAVDGRAEPGIDSGDVLGRQDSAAERLRESSRFTLGAAAGERQIR
jgi:GFO/IDH/MocA oxidoreductase family protein